MTQKLSKTLLAAGAGALVLGVGGWLVASHMADARAEAVLAEYVEQNGLSEQVSWHEVSASPFGKPIRIDGFRAAKGGESIEIARIEVRDYIDEPRHKRADIRLSGVVIGGELALANWDFVQESGRSDLPPADLAVFFDLDLERDASTAMLELNQPDLMYHRVEAELDTIAPLVEVGERVAAHFEAGNPEQLVSDAFTREALSRAGEARIKRFTSSYRDDGLMQRRAALHKRYSVDLSPAEENPDAVREARFREDMAYFSTECEHAIPAADPATREQACGVVVDFISGDSPSIQITSRPQEPVALEALLTSLFFAQEGVFDELGLEVAH